MAKYHVRCCHVRASHKIKRIILIFCQPSDPLELLNKFRNDLCENILNRMRNENQDMTLAYSDDIYNDGLIIIENKIREICDKSLTDFWFPAVMGKS